MNCKLSNVPDDRRQLLCETHMSGTRTTQYGFAYSRVARGSARPPFRQTHMTSIEGAVGQRYARAAGILLLLSIVFGSWGEAYVPSKLIVSGDAAATAQRILASPFMFRTGFAAYLIEAACDVTLALVFYVLLRPVDRHLALLSAFLGIVATVTYAFAECFYFAPSLLLSGADYLRTFTAEQLNSLAL